MDKIIKGFRMIHERLVEKKYFEKHETEFINDYCDRLKKGMQKMVARGPTNRDKGKE